MMKYPLTLLIFSALAYSACGQTTSITVMADTNRAVRTNFTIGNAQVTGLQALLDAKLNTNGNGAGVTNLTGANVVGTVATASNITGILAISNGGTGSSSASNARVALGLGTAATNPSSAFQPASLALTNLANNNGGALTNLSATNFLPAYTSQDGKVLAVATGGTNIEWVAISNTVTDASTLTNFPAAILQTNSADGSFPAFLLRTNGSAAALTNFPTLNQNTTGTASNVTGVVALANGGTGATNAANARVNLLPAYSNNASKVLALNTNATEVEWITITNTGGGGTSGVTSVDVSGGTTGLTTSGGPITNSGTITLGGTLSIAAGGTGQTNAAAAIEALLPAYTNNAGKVLGLDTNLALVWTTNAGGGGGGSGTVTSIDASGGSTGMNFTGGPVTTNGTLTLGGTLAIGNGGTGASDLTNARINLLPAYSGNAGKALALNTNGTDIQWITVPAVPVSIANGGTGATNTTNALINLTILNTNNGVRIGPSSLAISGVAIGNSARAQSTNGVDGANGVAIGGSAYASTNGVSVGHNAGSVGGVAIGSGALTGADAIAVGKNSAAEPGIAIGTGASAYEVGAVALGDSARADNTNSIQLGTGTNSTENTIQANGWGLVASNSWGALANSTTIGREIMQAPTNGTNGQALIWTNNDVAWATISGGGGGGTVDLASTNVTGILPVANGGSGASTGLGALTNFGVFTANSGVFITTIATNTNNFAVVIGIGATNGGTGNTVIGNSATGRGGTGSGGVAIGRTANTTNSGTAVGYGANANGGLALGESAIATNGVQIGAGANSTANTIQFRAAGLVDTNEWSALANASTQGRYAMTNTAGISATNTIVGYDGTNYVTNVITVINGIITGWTQ